MNPFLSDELARQHIEGLLQSGTLDRVGASLQRPRPAGSLRRALGMRLVSAGLVLIDGRSEPLSSGLET